MLFFVTLFLESLTSIKSSLDSYSCPFFGFREKIRFETVVVPLFGPFHGGPVMRGSFAKHETLFAT